MNTPKKLEMMFQYARRYAFSITVILTVVYLSLMNPPTRDIPYFPGWDKIVHFCMYGGVAGIIWLEYLFNHRKDRLHLKRGILAAVVCPLLLGGLLEIGQSRLTAHRSGDWLDFAANTGGIVAAALIAWFIFRPRIMKK
ncbi:MAG: VanZ family protein [Tannerella sp.]|jgi:VanZ family protein|nr:VanZ family protein [Tannerella sp.]